MVNNLFSFPPRSGGLENNVSYKMKYVYRFLGFFITMAKVCLHPFQVMRSMS